MFIEEIERLERQEEFIKKAKLKNGNKFDYSKVKYIDSITNITIICNKHKIEFSQKPAKHFQNKYHCPLCAKEAYSRKRRISKLEFIKQANKVHKNKFSYKKSMIQTRHDKILIYCKKHKLYFEQRLNIHLKGFIGCSKCISEDKTKRNREYNKINFINSFIKKFGPTYDFSKVKYIDNKTPVYIYCKKHNLWFWQVPRNINRTKSCSCSQCKSIKNM